MVQQMSYSTCAKDRYSSKTKGCDGNYFEVEGCMATCNMAKLVIHTTGLDSSGDVEVPRNPTSLTIIIERPDGSVLTFYWTSGGPNTGVERLDTGLFVIEIFLSLYGAYDVKIQTTGKSKSISGRFFVEDSGIDCDSNAEASIVDSSEILAGVLDGL